MNQPNKLDPGSTDYPRSQEYSCLFICGHPDIQPIHQEKALNGRTILSASSMKIRGGRCGQNRDAQKVLQFYYSFGVYSWKPLRP
jgi:hypothetical protein